MTTSTCGARVIRENRTCDVYRYGTLPAGRPELQTGCVAPVPKKGSISAGSDKAGRRIGSQGTKREGDGYGECSSEGEPAGNPQE
jgi:hypothetical protein